MAIEGPASVKAIVYSAMKSCPLPGETHMFSRQWRSLRTPDAARRIVCGGAYILHSRFAISYAICVAVCVLDPGGWMLCEAFGDLGL